MTEVAILGAGNGGFAFAGYLGLKGHKVRLFEMPQFGDNLTEVERAGGIEVIGTSEGFGKVDKVTTNIEEAIEGVELILVVVPAYAHRDIALACAPYVTEDQIVVLNPGSSFGVLEFSATLKEAGNHGEITIAETSSNIFGCRKVNDKKVNLLAVKNTMPVAAWPKKETENVAGKLKELFDEFEPASSILQTSLNNGNAIVHPAPAILNAGWIESSQGEFDFYWKGMSPSVCKVMESVDQERLSVGHALDYEPITLLESMHTYYEKVGETLHDFLSQSTVHGGPTVGTAASPTHLQHRYIAEDIPYGLVPYSELGQALGVETPYIDSLILLASRMNGIDYREEGRNLEKMGIQGKDPAAIKEMLLR